ncbi:MAG: chromosomal replication initiator DnaA [Rhodobacteraceae bacterium]|nr:chromosomal replication initiator DnaA [Paracoccaceae bacterium]
MAEQLNFDLPVRAALGRDDFFVSPANAMALGLVDLWPNWAGGKLVLSGPAGAGKTHLTQVWAALANAQVVAAADLTKDDVPALAKTPVAVEDVHLIADKPDAQTALFHLHNLTLAEGNTLLLTGIGAPLQWGLTLPDLLSRMQGTTVATLDQPDDVLLMAVMAKQFGDRQLMPTPDVLSYIAKHMDRSFANLAHVVEALDQLSLSEKRPITKALAKRVLEQK